MRGLRTVASSPKSSSSRVIELERGAHELAQRMPDLLVEAARISSTVAHGIHGRRRAGPGETFWQFRQYQNTDPATTIDWRRTASSTHVYVREREWEAAQTFYLWCDLSPSLSFNSHLSKITKRDRAIILMLATAELLVQGGERVALVGLTTPSASRRAMAQLAESLSASAEADILTSGLPPAIAAPRCSNVILFSDFLNPPAEIADRLNTMAGAGATGHLVQILDPAEETLPYTGRAEFIGPDGNERWIADRAESLRDDYARKLMAHRDAVASAARRLDWTFTVHHTDRSASEPLLNLIMRLRGNSDHAMHRTPSSTSSPLTLRKAGEADPLS